MGGAEMRTLISIDPGATCGMARWCAGLLVYARSLPIATLVDMRLETDTLAIEVPTQWARSSSSSILLLSERVGRIISAVRAGDVVRLYPSQWKGSTPKAICRDRIRRVLSEAEVARITGTHDAWDAVGIGLVALGRCGRGLV